MSSNWYFSKAGISNGPVSLDDLRRDLQSGVLGPETLVWNPSIPNWRPASDLAELRITPPPLPDGQSQSAFGTAPVTLAEPRRGLSASAPWSPHGPQDTNSRQGPGQIGPDGLYVGAPSRGFGEAISTCFNKYATFSGRASRSEYWFFYLFIILISLVTGILEAAGGEVISGLISLGLLLPSLAVTVRRLHDTNRSGWWLGGPALGILTAFLLATMVNGGANSIQPVAGGLFAIAGLAFLVWGIALTVVFCFKGDPDPNRFG